MMMIKRITFLFGLTLILSVGRAQNPGLLISEFLQNPAGTDSPFEYVEFLVTDNIDFSVTPYTIIAANNGIATTAGWIEGNAISYAFEITSGTVSIGDVVYVGGTSMTPTGVQLRVINTGTTGGDGGIGNLNAGGVIGNGGTSSDGIAVFNLPAASITSTTVPTDAVFYGTAHGTAVVGAGVDGYQLPVNDLYSGGKLQTGSFAAVDEDLTIAQGIFDLLTNTFTVARTFATGAASDGVSDITFAGATPPGFSFTSTNVTYDETAGTISFDVSIVGSNALESSADFVVRAASTANAPSDFVLGSTAVYFPGASTGVTTYTIDLVDDLLQEESEYIILTMENFVNAELTGTEHLFIYITDDDRIIPTATNEIKFELLTSYSNGVEGTNSAEIVAYDSSNFRLFIANSIGNSLDIVDFSDPTLPVAFMSINLDTVGSINSVAVFNGLVAVALQDLDPQATGYVSFFDGDGNWLNRLDAGAMPDMLTFNQAGDKLVVACEGEPSNDYLTDPEGTVAIINLNGAIPSLTQTDVTSVNFNAYNGQEAVLILQGIRIFGPGANTSMDFEPEYVTILDNDSIAYVVLQENNALAVININTGTILDIVALGTIDHSIMGYGMDVSNVTSGINIANFPVHGYFLPDAISSLNIGGSDYLFTANEGDTRAWGGFSEETRVKDVMLDGVAFPDAAYLQDQYLLGRLLMTTTAGDIGGDLDFDEIYTIGTRSFSIWDATTGALVFDSGDMIEQIISNDPIFVNLFNASNTAGAAVTKNRSDDKGPEVEGITVATIDGNHFVFVSLERVGGVLILNVNDPANPEYVGYANNRDALSNGPDRGAEGIIYVSKESSPNGNALLLLANEISSTLSVFQLNTCSDLSGLSITTDNGDIAFCENDSLLITANQTGTLTHQWMFNGTNLPGETQTDVYANSGGFYQLNYQNAVEMCSGKTDSLFLDELSAPLPTINVTSAVLSTQTFDTYQWYFEGALIVGATNIDYTPTADGDYEVVVTNADGCEGSATYAVAFTGVQDVTKNVYSVYPNPANTSFTIKTNQNQQDVLVRIFDTKGTLVYQELVQQLNQNYTIKCDDLMEGIYLINLVSSDATNTVRLVIGR